MAMAVALLVLIPILTAIWMEDNEMVERYGDVHREYIKRTPSIIPWKKPIDFLRLMVNFKNEQEEDKQDEE